MAAADPRKLRPLEWLLTLMAVTTGGGLASFFFRALPEKPELLGDGASAALLGNLGFQVVVLAAALVLTAAGLAERVTRGSERATTFLLIGNGVVFVAGLLVYFSLARV
jgi:hypothetical protein